ncbi:MAG: toxin-antitoxin system HicB family antitoxin [Verrucomicrobia bacterium]|nr:MAG: toxin-antitoxin system HicB family antitoxin [Verrucomicrobiota bacterium]
MKKRSDAYLKVIEWSEEDQCYIGTSPGLMLGGVHGTTEEKVYEKLCRVIDEWTEQSESDHLPLPPATIDKKYSGKFVLRVGEDVHKALSIRAMQKGESLNSYCRQVLEKSGV